jgi:hypothetical protein
MLKEKRIAKRKIKDIIFSTELSVGINANMKQNILETPIPINEDFLRKTFGIANSAAP